MKQQIVVLPPKFKSGQLVRIITGEYSGVVAQVIEISRRGNPPAWYYVLGELPLGQSFRQDQLKPARKG